MNYPQIDKTMIEAMGIATDVAPIAPLIDYRVDVKPQSKLMPQRDFSYEECLEVFGAREAVLMNFIPQMLTALALEQAEEFINYCRDNRLSEYKRHTREMRKCINEYNYELRKSYGKAWFAYERYLAKLRETVAIDLFKCWCTFTNEAAHQYIGHSHKDVPARVALIRMLLTFVEDFDKNVDKVIAARINAPCHRKQDPYCVLISALLIDIAETFGQKMKIEDTMTLCVKVLANKCHRVVDEIMAEEDAEEAAKQ